MVLANDDPDRCDAGSSPARGLTMSKTDDDADDKSERIDQLEAVVREQQRELEALAETLGIENPREEAKKYSRRAALGLGAAGVAGAAGYATGRTSAQSQPAGTIGDGDEAVDVQSVTTEQLYNNGGLSHTDTGITWDRPKWGQTTEEAVQVPQDEPTIQDALRKVPEFLIDNYTIEIDATQGPYDEDVIVPPTIAYDFGGGSEGVPARLFITNQDSGNKVAGATWLVYPAVTRGPTLEKVEIPDSNPYNDDKGGFEAHGDGFVEFRDADFTGGDSAGAAIVAYGATVKARNIDFGSSVVSNGVEVKSGGYVQANNFSGTASDYLYEFQGGIINEVPGTGQASGASGLVDPNHQHGVLMGTRGINYNTLRAISQSSGYGQTTKAIGGAVDSDQSNALSLSVSDADLDTFEHILVIAEVAGAGAGSFSDVSIQAGGATSGYSQNHISGGTLSNPSGNSAWNYSLFNTATQRDRFLISNNPTDAKIRQLTGSDADGKTIVSGVNGADTLDSVSLSTAFNASGWVLVLGKRGVGV
jgi:hypothetical protein